MSESNDYTDLRDNANCSYMSTGSGPSYCAGYKTKIYLDSSTTL